MLKTSKARIAAASTVMGLAAVAAPVALAGPAAAAGGTAPACVSRSVNAAGHYVDLANWCNRTMRITVVFKDGSETPCFTMSNGGSLTVRYGSKTYARTAVC
ncbi:hypothetical protein ACH4VT_12005 [Streptomyces lydicus]|uniref:hypothetical protein n=1 Tax=Streptomyces lydicus TaxID=47763 RepID=UPI0037963CBF